MYSLDNLAQGQIIRSPRNTGKGHINLPAEGLALRQEEGREAACGGFITLKKARQHLLPQFPNFGPRDVRYAVDVRQVRWLAHCLQAALAGFVG